MADDRTDEQLLAAWRRGDQRAGIALFTRYHKPLAQFFGRMISPDTDDLIQATFMGLLTGLDRFRGEASVRTLIYAIARNQLNAHLRRLMADRGRFDPDEHSIAAIDTSPSQVLIASFDKKLLLAALRELPVDTQLMLVLHYWERFKIREIAEVLDMAESTIKTRMRRGREQLQRAMERLAANPDELEDTMTSLTQWAMRLREELDDDDDGS